MGLSNLNPEELRRVLDSEVACGMKFCRMLLREYGERIDPYYSSLLERMSGLYQQAAGHLEVGQIHEARALVEQVAELMRQVRK